jgi:hypothetical protein
VSGLLQAVDALDVKQPVFDLEKVAPSPSTTLDPELTAMVDRYASGVGRYEQLDGLSRTGNSTESTLDIWRGLCSRASAEPEVEESLAMRGALIEAMRRQCREGGLEASTYEILESINPYVSSLSAHVALRLYEKARRVASILDTVTYYTADEFPLLGEAVLDLKPPAAKFFQYSVALIDDDVATDEELGAYYSERGFDEE